MSALSPKTANIDGQQSNPIPFDERVTPSLRRDFSTMWSSWAKHTLGSPIPGVSDSVPTRDIHASTPGTKDAKDYFQDLLRKNGKLLGHASLADESTNIASVIAQVLSQYHPINVEVHVSGCHLEDRPWLAVIDDDATQQLQVRYFDASSHLVEDQRVAELHLDQWIPYTQVLSANERLQIEEWTDRVSTSKTDFANSASRSSHAVGVVVVWCKWVQGQVVFASKVDELSVEFSGWASDLAHQRQKVPPVVCAETGLSDYRVTQLPDGQVTVFGAVQRCEASGREVPESRLTVCAATGKRVLEEYLTKCPVTEKRVHTDALIECHQCGQPTSPEAMEAKLCEVCRHLEPLLKGQRLVDQWIERTGAVASGNWWGAQRGDRIVLVKKGWMRHELWVFGSEPASPSHRVRRIPWGEWKDVD